MAFTRRDALILGTAGAAALAAGFGTRALLRSKTPGATLRAARFTDLSGRSRQLSEWRGRIIVCNFWATWCPPCRREIPTLVALRAQFASKGVEFVGIAVDSADKVARYATERGVTYPLLVAGADAFALLRALGDAQSALPFTVVLGRRGEIVYRKLGALQRGPFETELQRITAT